MQKIFVPLRSIDFGQEVWGPNDTLVLIGEVFHRGYVNGLVEAAQKRRMRIIQATVGRRDENDQLRSLTQTELANCPFECINIPLEAGFSFEVVGDEKKSLLDRLNELKILDWPSFTFSTDLLEQARQKARERFLENLTSFCEEIKKRVQTGHIIFAHLMAGGVPRSKTILALLNRTVKGRGNKFLSSQELWESALGQVINANFYEVTAYSFELLLQASKPLREQLATNGRKIFYIAYGYHGTEVFIQNQLKWQSYAPYLQGWAKLALEDFAVNARNQGICATVYNCPEILTQSSAIFQGVEIPLYPLLQAFQIMLPEAKITKNLLAQCEQMLKAPFEDILAICNQILTDPDVLACMDFEHWPNHNSSKQLTKILDASDQIISMHQDPKQLVTFVLSEIVLKSCGEIMLNHVMNKKDPIVWLGHDIVVKTYHQLKS